MKNKVYEVTITSKGQMVIPKKFREEYNLKRGTKVKVIAEREGIMIKPYLEGPSIGLRGMLKRKWANVDVEQLIEEAKKSLFKGVLS